MRLRLVVGRFDLDLGLALFAIDLFIRAPGIGEVYYSRSDGWVGDWWWGPDGVAAIERQAAIRRADMTLGAD
jgi:hypothetical protein